MNKLKQIEKEYKKAKKELAKGNPVASMFLCDCYKLNYLYNTYNYTCWRCAGVVLP